MAYFMISLDICRRFRNQDLRGSTPCAASVEFAVIAVTEAAEARSRSAGNHPLLDRVQSTLEGRRFRSGECSSGTGDRTQTARVAACVASYGARPLRFGRSAFETGPLAQEIMAAFSLPSPVDRRCRRNINSPPPILPETRPFVVRDAAGSGS